MNTLNSTEKIQIYSEMISVVIPVYLCANCLNELCRRLKTILCELSVKYEIILVNDASPDNSWEIIEGLAKSDEKIRGVKLSRNFGQHHAITAGLKYVRGSWVIVMDCDLQDMPEQIPKLYQSALDGNEVVVGLRSVRRDNFVKRALSKAFFALFKFLSGISVDNRIGNFGIYSRKVINSVNALNEQNRSFGALVLWVGYKRAEIVIEHSARFQGKSSYNFGRMAGLAFDTIIAHSDRLLKLTVYFGFSISMAAFSYAAWIVAQFFLLGTPVAGWSSLMVSIYFSTGLIIATIGIVGLYIGKIFDEVKGRPLYLIDATTFEVI